ncbi:hypothetical protein HGRIS_000125 [Hohenbuehelia grisea]|uniref:Uncharacterized protein n=1 Tax=Hohenbuehelia grisea TaxID=104357 RepID=A0ABR3JQ45_9AGAR
MMRSGLPGGVCIRHTLAASTMMGPDVSVYGLHRVRRQYVGSSTSACPTPIKYAREGSHTPPVEFTNTIIHSIMLFKVFTISALATVAFAQSVTLWAYNNKNCVDNVSAEKDTALPLTVGRCVDITDSYSFKNVVVGQPPDNLGHDCRVHIYPNLRCAETEFRTQGPLVADANTTCFNAPWWTTKGKNPTFFSAALVC